MQRIKLGVVGRYHGQTRRRRVCPREVPKARERGSGGLRGVLSPPSWSRGRAPGNVFANKCYGDAIWGLLRGTFETTLAMFLRPDN